MLPTTTIASSCSSDHRAQRRISVRSICLSALHILMSNKCSCLSLGRRWVAATYISNAAHLLMHIMPPVFTHGGGGNEITAHVIKEPVKLSGDRKGTLRFEHRCTYFAFWSHIIRVSYSDGRQSLERDPSCWCPRWNIWAESRGFRRAHHMWLPALVGLTELS